MPANMDKLAPPSAAKKLTGSCGSAGCTCRQSQKYVTASAATVATCTKSFSSQCARRVVHSRLDIVEDPDIISVLLRHGWIVPTYISKGKQMGSKVVQRITEQAVALNNPWSCPRTGTARDPRRPTDYRSEVRPRHAAGTARRNPRTGLQGRRRTPASRCWTPFTDPRGSSMSRRSTRSARPRASTPEDARRCWPQGA